MNNFIFSYYPRNPSILRLIDEFTSKHQDVFNTVKKDWLPTMRDFIREETGLKHSQKIKGKKIEKDTSVTFDFKLDRDDSFLKALDERFPNLDYNEYSKNKRLYHELLLVKNIYVGRKHQMEENYNFLINFLQDYLKDNYLEEFLKNKFKENASSMDVWGTYFGKDKRIEIYYLPLMLFSMVNDTPIEFAIVSTLVHEVAHHYHYCAMDKDGNTWEQFFKVDRAITESLAEYYTDLFVSDFSSQFPMLKKVNDKMFTLLPEDYTRFKEWEGKYKKESIKAALISSRTIELKNYEAFVSQLEEINILMSKGEK